MELVVEKLIGKAASKWQLPEKSVEVLRGVWPDMEVKTLIVSKDTEEEYQRFVGFPLGLTWALQRVTGKSAEAIRVAFPDVEFVIDLGVLRQNE